MESVCRLCMIEGESSISLFHAEEGDENHFHFIREIFRIQVEVKEGWPSHLCIHCDTLIKCIKEFRKTIEWTQEQLQIRFGQLEAAEEECAPLLVEVYDKEDEDDEISIIVMEADTDIEWKDSEAEDDPKIIEGDPSASPTKASSPEPNEIGTESPSPQDNADPEKRGNSKLTSKRKMNGDKSSICDLCGKVFKNAHCLRVHMRIHVPIEDRTKHPCKICGKIFNGTRNLYDHVKIVHKQSRSGVCPLCGKFNIHIKVHMRNVHSVGQQEPFKTCHICDKVVKADSMPKHLQRHGPPTFPCPECGKMFKRSSDLHAHKVVHEDVRERTIKCLFCPHTALRGIRYSRVHMRNKHPKEYKEMMASKNTLRTRKLEVQEGDK